MSALPLKAEMLSVSIDVRYVPRTDIVSDLHGNRPVLSHPGSPVPLWW